MVSKIFKAKYFSNGNFLEAQLGHNPSFVCVVSMLHKWCSMKEEDGELEMEGTF